MGQHMGSWVRLMATAVLVLALAAPLAACGKKGKLDAPEGATYPRDYPTR